MIGERILQRLAVLGQSQSWLARQVGITQPAINGLIRGSSRSSAHLHKIARALQTSVEYLTGETDDPDMNALAPPAMSDQRVAITMTVVLPPAEALEKMFRGMLRAINPEDPQVELAGQLAELLPTALSRLRDLRLESGTRLTPTAASGASDLVPATAHLESQ